jgi:hypothetical protein
MMLSMRYSYRPTCILMISAFAFAATAQTLELTPRELYYKPKIAVNPQHRTPKGNEGRGGAQANSGPAVRTREDGTKVVRVNDNETRLGLKYVILSVPGGKELPASTVFHTGEHIQVRVEANSPGYLYIATEGASGKWDVLFPSAKVARSNRVEAFQAVTLPSPNDQITFYEPPGAEKLFIVLSRDPIPDLKSLTDSLQKGAQPATHQAAVIDDGQIQQLRASVRPRDLIIEPVTPTSRADSSGKTESATYVVSAPGTQDSRVVADIHLSHK